MRDRGSVIITKHNSILLIKRKTNGVDYLVFPGGGVEPGETPKDTAKREAWEELGIEVKIKECVAEIPYNGTQYFFNAEIVGGTLESATYKEFLEKDKGTYLPLWVPVNQLTTLDIRPKEVAFKLMATLTKKTLEVGGFTKGQLIKLLHDHDVLLNNYGEQLLADKTFSCSKKPHTLEIIEVTVKSLGFPNGATLPEIYQRAQELGLTLCSLETGIYLRLMYLDQPIAESSPQNQAPSGSITIASKPISENHDIPKGFYLRNIDGQLWLRGYTADDLHVWNACDCFIFADRDR